MRTECFAARTPTPPHMADAKKLIVVTGATGAQGGSVVRHLLKDGKYAIRAVTRKADSPAAQGTHRSLPRAGCARMCRGC